MPSPLKVSLTFTASIIGWSLCVVMVYFAYKVYAFRSNQALQKRHPPLVYLITVSMVFFIGFSQSIMHILWLYYSDKDPGADVIIVFDDLFYTFSVHGAMIAMISRAWMIYFNIKWGFQTETEKWSVHIDPSKTTSFWFIQHRKDYGSIKYIFRFAFLYYLSVGLLIFIVRTIGAELIAAALDALLYLLEIITLIIIWNKIPTFGDIFGVKSELKYVLRCAVCGLTVYIIFIVIENTLAVNKEWLQPIFFIIVYFCIASIVLTFNGYVFFSKYKYLLATNDEIALTSILNAANSAIQNKNENENVKVVHSLSNTLKDEILFGAFFKHLSDEFSSEILLSFIEFTQFKKLIQNESVINIQNDDKTGFDVPAPPSYIVFEAHKDVSNKIEKYLLISIDLFKKYVDYSSEFEINISYECRMHVMEFINKYRNSDINSLELTDIEQYGLYSLYDDCIQTVFSLMTFAHSRFIETTRFTSIND